MTADPHRRDVPAGMIAALRHRVEAVVDVGAGLQDVLASGRHAELRRAAAQVIDVEAGLRAIVPEAGTRPPAAEPYVYYRGADIVVTGRQLTVPGPLVFDLDELRGVHVVRGSRRVGRLLVSVLVLLGVVLGVVVAWPSVDTAAERVATVMLPGVAAIAGLVLRRWIAAPDRLFMVGQHLGEKTVLFSSSDMVVFGQVRRALMRAFETRSRDLGRSDLGRPDLQQHYLDQPIGDASWWRSRS